MSSFDNYNYQPYYSGECGSTSQVGDTGQTGQTGQTGESNSTNGLPVQPAIANITYPKVTPVTPVLQVPSRIVNGFENAAFAPVAPVQPSSVRVNYNVPIIIPIMSS
jgi:hypothetical protein